MPENGPRWGPDLRLTAPALTAWASAGVVVGHKAGLGAVAAGFAAAAASAFAAAAVTAVPAHTALRRALVAIGVCLAGVALIAVSVWVQTDRWAPDAFDEMTAHHRSVDAVVTVSRPPTRLKSPDRFSGEDRYVVRGRLTQATGGGEVMRMDAPVTIFAGDSWGSLAPGTTVHGRLNLSPPGAGRRAAALCRPLGTPVIDAPAVGVPTMTRSLREGLRDAASGLSSDSAGLLPGLVDGDTSRVPESLSAAMKDTGLVHLVAVSGSNLAILAGAVLLAGVLTGVARWVQLVGAAVVLLGYVLVVGPDPSVLRSAVMAWVALLGLLSGRGGRGLPALSLAVVVLLVVDPWFGRDFGFALSVLACAGLLICVRPWVAVLSRAMPRFVALAIAVPAAAQAFCAPVIVLLRPRLSLYAVPANLLAAPAVPAATILGVVAMVAGAVWMPAARFVAWWAGWGTDWIAGVARFFEGLPAATVPWPGGLAGAAVLIAATVAGCVLCAVALRSRRALVITAGLTAACVGLLWRPVTRLPDRWLPVAAPVVICDVGQGSGAVVRTGEHAGIVFDAGEEPADIDACLTSMGIRDVPLIVLSHFDLDHVGGLPGVLAGRDVGRVLVSPLRQPPANAARVASELAAAGLASEAGSAGMSGKVGDVEWRLVWPAAAGVSVSGTGTASNESALVAYVTVAGARVIFPADLDAATQAALRRQLGRAEGSVPHADVLVVAHHGSADQDPRFNRALTPRVAVISVGADNDYGHPAPETMSMLAGMGVPTYRTDQCGSVAITLEPSLAVSTQHDCAGAQRTGRQPAESFIEQRSRLIRPRAPMTRPSGLSASAETRTLSAR